MTLTLDEVRKTKFHMARRTGYEVSEVDLFVDRVEASFAQLSEENQMLKQQLDALKQSQTRQSQSDQGSDRAGARPADPAKAADIPTSKVPTVSGAATEKLVVSTAAEASPAVIRLVQLATEQSEQLVREAAEDAKRKIDEANRKAEQIAKDAQNRAEDLDRQTGLRRTELFASLEKERDQLQAAVSQLRGFEASYRQNFVNHLKEQLRTVETATVEPASKPALADQKADRGGKDTAGSQSAEGGQGTSTPRLDALASDSQRKS